MASFETTAGSIINHMTVYNRQNNPLTHPFTVMSRVI